MIIPLEFWIILAIVCIILELMSLSFFLLSLGIGAIAAGILDYLGYDPVSQVIIFAVVSIVCIILSRLLYHKITTGGEDRKSNTERFIGKTAIVKEDIPAGDVGMVTIAGEEWIATSDEEIAIGSKVIVDGIDGIKLLVKK